jgi:hypothetical protein
METTEQLTSELMVEEKLTRADVVELVIDEMEENAEAKLAAANAAFEALPSVSLASLISTAPPDASVSVCDVYDSGHSAKEVEVTICYHIRKSAMPADYLEHQKKEDELTKAVKAAKQNLSTIQNKRGRVKNEIIRHVLRATNDGRKILSGIETIKAALNHKLLKSKIDT